MTPRFAGIAATILIILMWWWPIPAVLIMVWGCLIYAAWQEFGGK